MGSFVLLATGCAIALHVGIIHAAGGGDDRAIAYVEKLGGTAFRGKNSDGSSFMRVYLDNTRSTDSDLEALAPLIPDVTKLAVGQSVTDSGLKHLATFAKLTHLEISHTKVTDEGLKHVLALKSLTHLDIRHTPVTKKGLESLANLPNLTELILIETNLTQDEAKQLEKSLPNCRVVCRRKKRAISTAL